MANNDSNKPNNNSSNNATGFYFDDKGNAYTNKAASVKQSFAQYSFASFGSKWAKSSDKKLIIALAIITAIMVGVAIYFVLVPFSYYSDVFKSFVVILLILWSIPLLFAIDNWVKKNRGVKFKMKNIKAWKWIPAIAVVAFMLFNLSLQVFTSPLFISKEYRNIIAVNENGSFVKEIEDYTQMKIPIVDKALAMKLGDKRLGEDNLGSQFTINDYTMIEYGDDIFWVGVIEHEDFFKWLSNADSGSPGYVIISATDPSLTARIVKQQINFLPSAYFGQDLERQLYFGDMSLVRDGRINFELDEQGNPYYVQAVVKKNFAWTNGIDSYGCVILNAVTGDYTFYEIGEQPDWVDRVIPTEVALTQLNYWGMYKHGFFNTLFAKRELLIVSDGYNYVHHNGDLWLYTGLTSTGSDESIVGMVLCNLRTKETSFYNIGGATELAARSSAEGVVQHLRYSASFPSLINYAGQATYFMVLKDNEGLVKKYAYVNVSDYTKVGVGDTISEAQVNYNEKINITFEREQLTVSGIEEAVIDGNTTFLIKFNEKGDKIYKASIKLNYSLSFVKIGDTVEVRISEDIISEILI